MQAYSEDLRRRVAAACASGQCTIEQVASCFAVSVPFANKLLERQRTSGSVARRGLTAVALPRGCKWQTACA